MEQRQPWKTNIQKVFVQNGLRDVMEDFYIIDIHFYDTSSSCTLQDQWINSFHILQRVDRHFHLFKLPTLFNTFSLNTISILSPSPIQLYINTFFWYLFHEKQNRLKRTINSFVAYQIRSQNYQSKWIMIQINKCNWIKSNQ